MKKSPSPATVPKTPRLTVGENRLWHSYGLQRLNPERFRQAVNDILGRRSILIPPMRQGMITDDPSEWQLSESF